MVTSLANYAEMLNTYIFTFNTISINAQINPNLQLTTSTNSESYRIGDTLSLNYNVKNFGTNNVNAKLEVKVRFPAPDNTEHDLMPSLVRIWNNDSCCGDPKLRIGNDCEEGRYLMQYKNDYYCCKKPAKVQSPLPNCPITNNVVIPPNYPPNPTEWAGGLFKYPFRSDDGLPNGEYEITAQLKGQNNQDIVEPSVVRINKISANNLPTITLTSCQEITQSGNYILDRDIVSSIASPGNFIKPCLNIHDTINVHINCEGRSITAQHVMVIANVGDFSIKNCNLKEQGINTLTFEILEANNGLITNNNFGDFIVSVFKSSNIRVVNNIFRSVYTQQYSNNNAIENNIFNPAQILEWSAIVTSTFGSNNQIIKNRIDGRSDQIFRGGGLISRGADDGIVLNDEKGDIIQENFIENNYDCGIETSGFISDTSINKNTIINSGVCGIGGWYGNSWKGNIVSKNIVDDAPIMFRFDRAWGIMPTPPTAEHIYFQDNIFSDNKFINPKLTPATGRLMSVYINMHNLESVVINPDITPGERRITSNDYSLNNNIFTNNDFGTTLLAPYLKPESMIVDGGGNICSRPTEANYPLNCKQS